jgi:hypothetical protein
MTTAIPYSQSKNSQNELLLNNLMEFYKDPGNIKKMMRIINGESKISLRIVDWFVTNFSKKYYTVYELPVRKPPNPNQTDTVEYQRFKVYNDYKLKLKAYNKTRFDPFCRWERINIPYDENQYMETTIGQLNFFKWALENQIIDYIEANYGMIESDMNSRNSTSKRRITPDEHHHDQNGSASKTRKKREELSISACKCIKKETVEIVVRFS